MSVRIKAVAKELPKYSRTTEEILPLLEGWLIGQDERFIRKVKKIFEGAMVDKRYSIMEPTEVFTNTSFEERNDIYVREVIDLGEKVLDKFYIDGIQHRGMRLNNDHQLKVGEQSIPAIEINTLFEI